MGTASMEVARHLLDQVAALYKCRPCFTPMGMAVQAQHGSAAAAAPIFFFLLFAGPTWPAPALPGVCHLQPCQTAAQA